MEEIAQNRSKTGMREKDRHSQLTIEFGTEFALPGPTLVIGCDVGWGREFPASHGLQIIGVAGRLRTELDSASFMDEDSEFSSKDEDSEAHGDDMFRLIGMGGGVLSPAVGVSGVYAGLTSFGSSGMSTAKSSPPAKRAGAEHWEKRQFQVTGNQIDKWRGRGLKRIVQ